MAIRLDDMCRTERYFTATLLPQVLFHDGFLGLKKFISLLRERGILKETIDVEKTVNNDVVQIITELSPRRDVTYYVEPIRRKVPTPHRGPFADIVIVIGELVIVIEGKLFSKDQYVFKLTEQIDEQKKDFSEIINANFSEFKYFYHILLTDDDTAGYIQKSKIEFDYPILCWSDILRISEQVLGENHYVSKRLRNAIERKAKEKSESNFNKLGDLVKILKENDDISIGFQGGKTKLEITPYKELLGRRFYRWVYGKGKNDKDWIYGKTFLHIIESIKEPSS